MGRHRFRTIAERRTSTERGYGWQHQKARKRYLAAHRPGDPCALCDLPMWETAGRELHLDHCPHCDGAGCGQCNGDGYRGLVHARCNKIDGAIRGNTAQYLQRHRDQQRSSPLEW